MALPCTAGSSRRRATAQQATHLRQRVLQLALLALPLLQLLHALQSGVAGGLRLGMGLGVRGRGPAWAAR